MDPVLLRFRSRLDHLDRLRPSRYSLDEMRALAEMADGAMLVRGANIQNAYGRDRIALGPYTNVAGEIAVWTKEASVRLGGYCYLGPGSRIWSQKRVEIGSYVLIAHLVDIHDTNAHSVDWRARRKDPIALFAEGKEVDWTRVEGDAVTIEDDVWIGFKSSIMKGVTIGRGSVVAAGSIVTRSIPPFSLVAGIPAQVIRSLDPGKM
jgi:acetyltransferase-like isoleucine patch superfamily enzyme